MPRNGRVRKFDDMESIGYLVFIGFFSGFGAYVEMKAHGSIGLTLSFLIVTAVCVFGVIYVWLATKPEMPNAESRTAEL